MLFLSVHCKDEIDRSHLIPLIRVMEVHTNDDGGDWVILDTRDIVYPRYGESFYHSIVDVQALPQDERTGE